MKLSPKVLASSHITKTSGKKLYCSLSFLNITSICSAKGSHLLPSKYISNFVNIFLTTLLCCLDVLELNKISPFKYSHTQSYLL